MIALARPSECTGCTACQAICPGKAIQMRPDAHGCLHPHVEESRCLHCHRCEQVCPALHPWPPRQESPLCFAAKARDERLRKESSSGGLFSLLANQCLAEGGCVFGCHWHGSPLRAIHAKATTPEELPPMRGSKYVQSDLHDSLQECQRELQTGRKVLFSGTPCQIAGLLHSLEGKKVDNLLTVELICHGAPMPAVFQEYLRQVEKKLGDTISDFHFRTKSPSWEEYQLQVSGKTKAIPSFLGTLFDSPYGKAFLLNLSLRDSCYHCPAKGGKSQADITLGDFWGIDAFYPEFNDHQGTSAILCHTPKGKEALMRLSHAMEFLPVELPQILKGNSSYLAPVTPQGNRKLFLGKYSSVDMDSLVAQCRKLPFPQRVVQSVLFRMRQFRKKKGQR